MSILVCNALPLHLINFAKQVQKVELVGQKAAVDSFTGLGARRGKAGIASGCRFTAGRTAKGSHHRWLCAVSRQLFPFSDFGIRS